jgi:hypothetical protein
VQFLENKKRFHTAWVIRVFDSGPATSGLPRLTDVIRPARLVRLVPISEVASFGARTTPDQNVWVVVRHGMESL